MVYCGHPLTLWDQAGTIHMILTMARDDDDDNDDDDDDDDNRNR